MRQHQVPRFACLAVAVGAIAGVSAVAGCVEFLAFLGCDREAFFMIRGKVVEADSGDAITDAMVNVRRITGEVSDQFPGLVSVDEDGGFAMVVESRFPLPCIDSGPVFPDPDAVEILVVRDACEQSFKVPINDDTAVRVVAGGSTTLELIDAIAVPPCE